MIRTVETLEERLLAHPHADVAFGARLRRQRPGRGARDRHRPHRRRRRQAHGLSVRASPTTMSSDADMIDHIVAPGRGQGRRDRGGRSCNGHRRRMSLLASVLLAAALASQDSASPRRWQGVQAMEVLAEGEPMAERRVERVNAFYSQHLLRELGIRFDITPAEFEALRDRFDLRRTVPFVLYEWRGYEFEPGGPPMARHLDYLHCSSRVTWGTTTTCFRDADSDGRLESVAVFQYFDFPESGLQFQPIDPVPYHYVQQPLVPVEVRRGTYAGPSLGIAWNYEEGNSGKRTPALLRTGQCSDPRRLSSRRYRPAGDGRHEPTTGNHRGCRRADHRPCLGWPAPDGSRRSADAGASDPASGPAGFISTAAWRIDGPLVARGDRNAASRVACRRTRRMIPVRGALPASPPDPPRRI